MRDREDIADFVFKKFLKLSKIFLDLGSVMKESNTFASLRTQTNLIWILKALLGRKIRVRPLSVEIRVISNYQYSAYSRRISNVYI